VTIFICGVIIDNLLNSGAKKAHQQLHRIGNRKYHSCSDGSSVMGGDTGLPNCYDDDNTIDGEGDGDDTLQDSWLWNHHRRTLLVDDSENNIPFTRTDKEVVEEEEEEVVAVVDSVVPSSRIPPRRGTTVQTMTVFSENRSRRGKKPMLRSF